MHSIGGLLNTDPGPFITTSMVVAEAAYLLDRKLGPDAEVALHDSILGGLSSRADAPTKATAERGEAHHNDEGGRPGAGRSRPSSAAA